MVVTGRHESSSDSIDCDFTNGVELFNLLKKGKFIARHILKSLELIRDNFDIDYIVILYNTFAPISNIV